MKMRRTLAAAAVTLLGVITWQNAGAVDRDPKEEAERWALVRGTVFDKPAEDGQGLIELDAPYRAIDAALVPLTVRLDPKAGFKGLTIFIDNNPAPLVGRFQFGPAINPTQIKVRVRVNDYTLIHAIGETKDGRLLEASRYLKAAGGCSAPATGQGAEDKIGQMQLRRTREEGKPVKSQLLINHPNYNGLQMGAGANAFIPPRYLETISVTTGGQSVFELSTSISLSEDPSVSFEYIPAGDGTVQVVARDSKGSVFEQKFEALN